MAETYKLTRFAPKMSGYPGHEDYDPSAEGGDLPNQSDPKSDWVDAAETAGIDPAGKTKAELIDELS